ncbi:sulfotransferase 1B1-like [Haliotis rubra]|uniref:sulfotransferase 1B1-like n=1 Tax=Haliotis rubra TaxID=36100 RepID=UPI001EE50C42|nr:sulfotransferase 1B1-like [Haliotis rubra]
MIVNCYKGCYFYRGGFPIPFDEHMKRVEDMKLRSDDVLLCTYPKSGTHWLWEVISMILHEDLEYRENVRGMDMLDFAPMSLLDSIKSPRVLGCHFRFQFLPKEVLTKKSKVVYVLRDPKAVAVSFYNMEFGMKTVRSYDGHVPVKEYNGKWEDYLELFLNGDVEYGSWFDHTLGWQQAIEDIPDLEIFLLKYEDMKHDPVSSIQKLSKYLDKPCNVERAQAIADACSFSNIKKVSSGTKADGVGWKEGGDMFRKGQTNNWKEWFTVAQNERFEDVLKTKMNRSDVSK